MPEFIQNDKGPQAAEPTLKKESKDRRRKLPDIKTCLQFIILKPERYKHKDKQTKELKSWETELRYINLMHNKAGTSS